MQSDGRTPRYPGWRARCLPCSGASSLPARRQPPGRAHTEVRMTNILLLEDVPEASAWLKLQVAEVFAEPVFFDASRVNGALAIIAKEQIDVALIDLGLPDGSGVDVVVALRE